MIGCDATAGRRVQPGRGRPTILCAWPDPPARASPPQDSPDKATKAATRAAKRAKRRETWTNLRQAFTLTRENDPQAPALHASAAASSRSRSSYVVVLPDQRLALVPDPVRRAARPARRHAGLLPPRPDLDVHPGRGPGRRGGLDAAAAAARRLAADAGRRRHDPARRRPPAGRTARRRPGRRGRPAPRPRPDRAGEEAHRPHRRRHPDLRHHRRHRRGRHPAGQAQPLPAQAAGQPQQGRGRRAGEAAGRTRRRRARRCPRARCRRAPRCATSSAPSAART